MSNPNKQLGPPSKHWDGVPNPSCLKIPPFHRDTQQWLVNTAETEEKQRTQRVLQALEAQQPLEEKNVSPPRPKKAFVPMGDGEEGAHA